MHKEGITYLEKNRLLHIAMLESVRRGMAQVIHESEHGVLMLDQSSNVHMVSADCDEYGRYLVDEKMCIRDRSIEDQNHRERRQPILRSLQ